MRFSDLTPLLPLFQTTACRSGLLASLLHASPFLAFALLVLLDARWFMFFAYPGLFYGACVFGSMFFLFPGTVNFLVGMRAAMKTGKRITGLATGAWTAAFDAMILCIAWLIVSLLTHSVFNPVILFAVLYTLVLGPTIALAQLGGTWGYRQSSRRRQPERS